MSLCSDFDLHVTHGAAGVGITTCFATNGREYFVIAVVDGGTMYIYTADASVPLPSAKFTLKYKKGISPLPGNESYQSIALLTGTNNKTYLIGFRVEELLFDFSDKADLYGLSLNNDFLFPKIASREFTMHHLNIIGFEGVHFRYGAGIEINSEDNITFFATQRNFVGGWFPINIFGNSSLRSASATSGVRDDVIEILPQFKIYVKDGWLYVNSPQEEHIFVYSANGVELYRAKTAIAANTETGVVELSSISAASGSVLIVRGSSGWSKKIVIQ
jgi:hypothetical protein